MYQLLSPEDALDVYNKAVLENISANNRLTVDSVIDISLTLYKTTKLKDVDSSIKDDDMLLFQYGRYNWGDEKGDHVNLDITRQFRLMNEDEFYQLSFSLIYEPQSLENVDSYNTWSADFTTLEDWIASIKGTSGYQKLKLVNYTTYELSLSQT